jgi:hypothetical protein
MFKGCTALTQAPALPATTLDTHCYAEMFYGCTSLTKAPALPATTLVDRCYYSMFSGCTSLNEVRCAATTSISAINSTTNWLYGVNATGHFYGKSAAGWTTGPDGIPSGWTKHLE